VKASTYLQLLKETGMKFGEALMLKWTDFDLENRTINITPEKGSARFADFSFR
jgi:integrase